MAITRFKNLAFLLFMALVIAGLLTLGFWQIQRLGWKLELIELAERNAVAVPIEMSAIKFDKLDINRAQYQRVVLKGAFDHAHETYVTAVIKSTTGPRDGSGFWVLAPFVLEDGRTILVNRGFVPTRFQSPQARPSGTVAGSTQIEGLIRTTQPQGMITLDPDLEAHVFFSFDVAAMVAHLKNRAPEFGNKAFAPFFVDQAGENDIGYPKPGLTQINFVNNHLSYAITWFLMALAVTCLTLYWVWRQRRVG